MIKKVKVLVLRTAGTNCDVETAYAFKKVGASCDLIHVNKIISRKVLLNDYSILALPGGFTYGDDIASGKILANEIRFKLSREVGDFVADGKLMIGICNGFQVLAKSGLLPDPVAGLGKLDVTLSINDSGKFEDRWVYLRSPRHKGRGSRCVWTKGMKDIIYLPVAHAEGKFIPKNDKVLQKLRENGQIVFKYCTGSGKDPQYPDNPNGSVNNIAGICDRTGRIFGLMPHPERHICYTQHPRWTRSDKRTSDGLGIFENGVRAASKL
ncbi:MAG: phosphoribosylformylglycinamidine synthase I [Candidatus Omnitrophota bacterium]